jgi:two-component system, LytTR family, response regulator
MRMKTILIDDEPLALQGLKLELENIGGVEVVGLFDNGGSALDYLAANCPDVVFLDIEMPASNGLELFEKISEIHPNIQIVFVTAYREYAVEAFELNSADYLVKPVQRDRLEATLDRLARKKPSTHDAILDVRCFGHFSIFLDGEDINVNWRTRKSEELIAYLICNRGSFVSKEKIADALWPELDGDKSMANLYLAHYYIRKLSQQTGLSIPIESATGKMRFNFDQVRCDFIEFARLADTLGIVTSENIHLAEEALKRYHREPFEDSYYHWLIDFQLKCGRMRMDIEKKIEKYMNKE